MTTVERIRALQRHAGLAPTNAVAAQLRRLVGRRDASNARTVLEPPAGREIARGLVLVEAHVPAPASRLVAMPWGDPQPIERERLVCFDTETTGLAGGVGTRAFMIGVAMWRDDSWHVRQLYLTAIAGEQPMLDVFSSWLRADAVFVSYNGRSYDAPLLKGRFRLHRREHPFELRRHVDLLYPARRAYRARLPNCRLQTVEREILGIVREDDLPGALAPAAWLDYLRGHSSAPLGRVVQHNRQDLVSLASLLDRLAVPDDTGWNPAPGLR